MHGEEADGVKQEADARAELHHHRARERGAYDAREVDYRRIERDGVHHVVLADEIDEEGKARGNVYRRRYSEKYAERQKLPILRGAAEGERRERDGLDHQQRLRDDDDFALREAVHYRAREERE